jgi:protein MpaA
LVAAPQRTGKTASFKTVDGMNNIVQRLGKNLGGYFGETIDLVKILQGIEEAAKANGWKSEDFLHMSALRLFALRREAREETNLPIKRIYISTGIHGDEPAGPMAALRLLLENQWPDNCDITLCPCLNPTGFVMNRRGNKDSVDLNRDYLEPKSEEIRAHIEWLKKQDRFQLSLCLHEDWESHGFYVYELNPDHQPSLAEAIVEGVAKVCPIDQSEIIEDREAKGGIIRPLIDPRGRPQWPEAFWLISNKSRLSYTLEAPSDFPLVTRVDALVAAVRAVLKTITQ